MKKLYTHQKSQNLILLLNLQLVIMQWSRRSMFLLILVHPHFLQATKSHMYLDSCDFSDPASFSNCRDSIWLYTKSCLGWYCYHLNFWPLIWFDLSEKLEMILFNNKYHFYVVLLRFPMKMKSEFNSLSKALPLFFISSEEQAWFITQIKTKQ